MREIKLPKTVEWTPEGVRIVDQLKLPHKLEFMNINDHTKMAYCIKNMNIRGAPVIGAAAAFGLALAAKNYSGNKEGFGAYIEEAADLLRGTRQTAVNLFWAIDRVLQNTGGESLDEMKASVIETAKKIAQEDEQINRKIGEHGATLIKNGFKIGTHCNAGSLATVYYGTALAPVYCAWEHGKNVHVIVDETRPRFQGALTAWELSRVGIPFTVITDNMSAYFMKKTKIDAVIVGADRIAMNGDVANKIGTYGLSIIAKEHKVPFYVAAPTSTIDRSAKDGNSITIEQRRPEEVLGVKNCQIFPKNTPVWNPAFDVTPAGNVTAIITECGAIRPANTEIENVLERGRTKWEKNTSA